MLMQLVEQSLLVKWTSTNSLMQFCAFKKGNTAAPFFNFTQVLLNCQTLTLLALNSQKFCQIGVPCRSALAHSSNRQSRVKDGRVETWKSCKQAFEFDYILCYAHVHCYSWSACIWFPFTEMLAFQIWKMFLAYASINAFPKEKFDIRSERCHFRRAAFYHQGHKKVLPCTPKSCYFQKVAFSK
jgi:hypothetical protein